MSIPEGVISVGEGRPAPAGEAAGAARAQPLWTRDFVLVCLVNLLATMGIQLMLPVLPLYMGSFGALESTIGLLIGMYPVAALAIRPAAGLQADRHGRRGVLLAGLTLHIAVFVAYALVPSIAWLAAIRLAHGLSWGMITTAGGAVVADLLPAARRGEGMGYYAMLGNVTMALAPTIGLAATNSFGFTAFFVADAGTAVLAVLLACAIRYPPVAATAAPARLVLVERRAVAPAAIALCGALAIAGVVTFLPLHARQLGIDNIGPFYAVYAVTMAAIRPLAGRLYDRRGPALVTVGGLLFGVTAMLVLATATALPTFLVAGVLVGIGFGALQPTLQAMAVGGVPPERRGAASSTYYSFFDSGFGLGAVILGWVAEAYDFPTMYVAAAALTAVGLAVFAVLRPDRTDRP
ncbi:MAG: MFS transporter [Chloroflexi bacterium]|nr:MFS transporter [Chloroflexota bacterium]